MDNETIWENIHNNRAWGRYPNEELIRFIAKNYYKYPKRWEIKILELGCGQGANLWYLSKEGFDTYGIDISKKAIEKTRTYLFNENECVKLTVQNMEHMDFSNELFDLVIDISSIQVVNPDKYQNIYKEIHRILRPSGLFWSFHLADNHKTFNVNIEGNNYGFHHSILTSLMNKAGFSIENIERHIVTYNNQQDERTHWMITMRKT